ncbi:hypothetical protein E1285_39590, partial [Actinomadura sp. 7K507]
TARRPTARRPTARRPTAPPPTSAPLQPDRRYQALVRPSPPPTGPRPTGQSLCRVAFYRISG